MSTKTTLVVATLSAAFVSALPTDASAQYGGFSCTGSPGMLSCHGGLTGSGSFPRIVHLRPPDEEDVKRSASRYREWVARCQPEFKQDRYGVSRAHYAAPNCDVGKTED